MIKCAVVVSLEHKHPTTQSFGISSGASKPWVCLLHCGDLKKPVLLPQWVPYTELLKNIHLCTSLSWRSPFGNAGSIS